MKKKEAFAMLEILESIKISAIKDRAVKISLLRNYLAIRAAVRKIREDNAAVADMMIGSLAEKRAEKDQVLKRLHSLPMDQQQEEYGRICREYADVIAVEDETATTLTQMMETETVDISLEQIDSLRFTDALEEAGADYTGRDIVILESMLDFTTLKEVCNG